MCLCSLCSVSITFFFFNDTATTEIYTLSLHDALPISSTMRFELKAVSPEGRVESLELHGLDQASAVQRSEEHTSELQSPDHLVCRLLLEKKKRRRRTPTRSNLSRSPPTVSRC